MCRACLCYRCNGTRRGAFRSRFPHLRPTPRSAPPFCRHGSVLCMHNAVAHLSMLCRLTRDSTTAPSGVAWSAWEQTPRPEFERNSWRASQMAASDCTPCPPPSGFALLLPPLVRVPITKPYVLVVAHGVFWQGSLVSLTVPTPPHPKESSAPRGGIGVCWRHTGVAEGK